MWCTRTYTIRTFCHFLTGHEPSSASGTRRFEGTVIGAHRPGWQPPNPQLGVRSVDEQHHPVLKGCEVGQVEGRRVGNALEHVLTRANSKRREQDVELV